MAWTTTNRKLRTLLEMEAAERRAICERIQQARKQAGFTQAEFAELFHVHKRTIENWENERVPWEHLQEIAQVTGRSRAWLLGGDEAIAEEENRLRKVVRDEMADVLAVLARLEAQRANGGTPIQDDDEPD